MGINKAVMKLNLTKLELRRIRFNVEELEQFEKFLAEAIKKEQKEALIRVAKETAGLTKDEEDNYFEAFGDDFRRIHEIFPSIGWNSFLVIIYAYVEIGLNRLCEAKKIDKMLSLSYREMGSKGIDRARVYLEKVAGLNLNTTSSHWQEIQCLSKVRNVIVHNEGWVNSVLSKDHSFVTHVKSGHIELDKNRIALRGPAGVIPGQVVAKEDYIERVLEAVKAFFNNLWA